MQDKLDLLEKLKQTDFEALECRLWVIKKSSHSGVNRYAALSADIDGLEEDFTVTLKEFFCGADDVQEPISSLAPYSALTVDLDDDRALVHSLDATDFARIKEKIDQGADNNPVENIQQFNRAWALVVEFSVGDRRFFAFSKVKGGWNIKRSASPKNWTFTDGHFKKVLAEKIFTFRNIFDFVAFGDDVFIRDKANYELGLNIREGLEAKRDVLIDAFAEKGIIACADGLKVAIGTNKTFLRRLVVAEETRFFEDQQFIEDMKAVINEHGFSLPSDHDGKFIIDESNIDLFLKLINDKRFTSLIKNQMVDADAVSPVEPAVAP